MVFAKTHLITNGQKIMYVKKHFHTLTFLSSFIFAFLGCTTSNENTIQLSAEGHQLVANKTIDATENELKVEQSDSSIMGASIFIPEGALDSSIDIQISEVVNGYEIENDPDAIRISFEPSGTEFLKPVELSIPFVARDDTRPLTVMYFDEENETWKRIRTHEIDEENNIAKAYTGHFTVFAVSDVGVVSNPNQSPIANAGEDREVNEGDIIILDSSLSTDDEGELKSVKWSFTGEQNIEIVEPDKNIIEIVAPNISEVTDLTFELVVTDLDGSTDKSKVTITVAPLFNLENYETADPLRGAKLYDSWWKVKNISTPTYANPIWNEISKDSTGQPYNTHGDNGGQWRCNECHGWDYKGASGAYSFVKTRDHYTGIDAWAATSNLFTKEHVFGMLVNGQVRLNNVDLPHVFVGDDIMNEEDIYDLTKFIFEYARIDIANPTAGEVNAGAVVFKSENESSCDTSGCHTSSSAQPIDQIIQIAQQSPAEFLHKVRYGTANSFFMPAGLNTEQAENLRAYVAAGAGQNSDGGGIDPSSDFSQTLYSDASVVLGGRIYDKWWITSNTLSDPITTHPLWPASNTKISGSDTWRCKECHGWDYRGRDGVYSQGKHTSNIIGIVNTTSAIMQQSTAAQVYTFLKTNTDHGFASGDFTDTEYYAATKFVMTMRAEMEASASPINFIDGTTKLATGDTDNGKTVYQSTQGSCSASNCHGADGKALDFVDNDASYLPNAFVHNIAQENPWEFVHKVRFGVAQMPALYDNPSAEVNTVAASIDVLAYSQTELLPEVKRAGLLYDKWWAVAGAKTTEPPAVRNANWDDSAGDNSDNQSDQNTWRCQACHGWDYEGVHGAYGDVNSKNYSAIRGFHFLQTQSNTKQYIIDAITDGPLSAGTDHNFGQYLNESDIDLLAQFILDDDLGIPANLDAYNAMLNDGDATVGKTFYQSTTPGNCESCHGADGITIPSVDLSVIAKNNPQKFLHKSRYGNSQFLGAMLPKSTGFAGLTQSEASDVLAYAKTLNHSVQSENINYANANITRGGRLYDKWWIEMQTSDDTVTAPSSANSYWNTGTLGIPSSIEATWRCKSCHAWDYKGTGYDGTNTNSGSDNLLFKINLRRSTTYANDETALQNHIHDFIKGDIDLFHAYGSSSTTLTSPLTDRELWDLTKFLLEESSLINYDSNILSGGIVIGANVSNGAGLYNGSINSAINCTLCHGADGDAIPPISEGGSGLTLDIFSIAAANENPWKFLHKIRFGKPGTNMTPIFGMGEHDNSDALDILGYAQKQYNARQ